MVDKSELEALESGCATAQQFVDLARQAVDRLADKEYARSLLTKAEMQCQFPADYVRTAEGFCRILEDEKYALDLLEQAEEACFDNMEYAEVACGYAELTDEPGKAAELFKQALDDTTDPGQILTLAGMAQSRLGDSELARQLYGQMEKDCDSCPAYIDLARSVLESGDGEQAKVVFGKAARYCDDIQQTVAYAGSALELFNDRDQVRGILEEAESDAQFAGQFVDLAHGFKTLLDDDQKVDELLESGAEFAMGGEEFIDLANGYWSLKQDRETASGLYEKGLPDVNDRDTLLALAKTAARDLENPDLAKTIYSKAESRVTGPGELMKLAESIFNDTADQEFAAGIYARAEQQIVGSHDLINLATHIIRNLDDREYATAVFRKAIEQSSDFAGASRVFDVIVEKLPESEDLIAAAVTKLLQDADSATDFLKIHEKSLSLSGDADYAATVLTAAEERVENLAEMKKVVEAVALHHADDVDWNARVAEKLKKRQANQSLYNAFQEQEKSCQSSREFLNLAEQVMAKLEDQYYARKLFAAAEERLDQSHFDLSQYAKLVEAIDRQFNDADWLSEIVRKIAKRARHFSQTHQISRLAGRLSDSELGRNLALQVLSDAAEQALNADVKAPAELIKLVDSIRRISYDDALTGRLLDGAFDAASGYLELSALAKVNLDAGNHDAGASLFEQAARAVATPGDLQSLVMRMRRYGVDPEKVKSVYVTAESSFTDKYDQLQWAEGLIDLFDDRELAGKSFRKIAGKFSQPEERSVFRNRENFRFEAGQDYLKPVRSLAD